MNLTLIKKIAKQGANRVIIIPRNLHPYLKEGEMVKVQIISMPNVEQQATEVNP